MFQLAVLLTTLGYALAFLGLAADPGEGPGVASTVLLALPLPALIYLVGRAARGRPAGPSPTQQREESP